MAIRSRFTPAAMLLGLAVAGEAAAAPFDNEPKVLLHLVQAPLSKVCSQGPASCANAVTRGNLVADENGPFYFALVLGAPGNLGNMQRMFFRISYDQGLAGNEADGQGIDVFTWTECSPGGSVTPAPAPGSSLHVDWREQPSGEDFCQDGENTVAGYFYLGAYSPGSFRLTPESFLTMEDCCGNRVVLGESDMGRAEFTAGGTTDGCNPCLEDCPGTPTPPRAPFPPCMAPPRILVHVAGVTSKNACAAGSLADCADAVVEGELSPPAGPFQFAFLLAADGNSPGIAGLDCGIEYEDGDPGADANGVGLDIFSWTGCADNQVLSSGLHAWPKPGGGILLTWNEANCQTGPVAVAGYFYLAAYHPDILRVVPREEASLAALAVCGGGTHEVPETQLGSAAFSEGRTLSGCNPCLDPCAATSGVPVTRTTWGAIKALR